MGIRVTTVRERLQPTKEALHGKFDEENLDVQQPKVGGSHFGGSMGTSLVYLTYMNFALSDNGFSCRV